MTHPSGTTKGRSLARVFKGLRLEFWGVRLRPEASAGVVLAVVLGAAPAAFMGLHVAWIVVASGSSALLVAPLLALRQVNAVQSLQGPASVTVHAGKTVDVTLDLRARRRAHGLLISLHRDGSSGGAADERHTHDGAPRLALTTIEPAARGARIEVMAPLRLALRGRYPELFAHLTSSFPLGLVTASVARPIHTEATALPRPLSSRDTKEFDALRALLRGNATDEAPCRSRGQGSPATLRPARDGDTARDLNLRGSYRRQMWIAVERTQLASKNLEVVLTCKAWDEDGGSHSRRGAAAFEAATSLAAAMILVALGEGVSAALFLAPDGHSQTFGSPASRGSRALAHLLALTDATYGGPAPVATDRLPAAPGGGTRLCIAPVLHLDRVDASPPPGFELCILVDPHGRTRPLHGLPITGRRPAQMAHVNGGH